VDAEGVQLARDGQLLLQRERDAGGLLALAEGRVQKLDLAHLTRPSLLPLRGRAPASRGSGPGPPAPGRSPGSRRSRRQRDCAARCPRRSRDIRSWGVTPLAVSAVELAETVCGGGESVACI